jgi:hypothetical protein
MSLKSDCTQRTDGAKTFRHPCLWGTFRGIWLRENIVDGVQRVSFNEIILRESTRFTEAWDIDFPVKNLLIRRRKQRLDGSTDLNTLVCHLLLSIRPTQVRDIFTWKDLKKWESWHIHRIFLSFYPVSIAITIISNHYEKLLTGFWFDAYSLRYLSEQEVSDFRGDIILCKTIILCTIVWIVTK